MWRLLKNVSLVDADGRRACDFTSGFVAAPTHLFGQVIADYKRSTAASPTAGGLAALGVSTGPDDAPDADAGGPSSAGDAALPHGDAFNSLSFGFIPGVFELPNDAQDKFMIIQNVTLQQLPQAPLDDSSSTTPKAGTGRRLAQLSATPPGIWTVLLHAWRRCVCFVVVCLCMKGGKRGACVAIAGLWLGITAAVGVCCNKSQPVNVSNSLTCGHPTSGMLLRAYDVAVAHVHTQVI